MGISHSVYKDVASFVLQSESLRAEFIPWGAKLVSLKGQSGRETLEQNPAGKYMVPYYGMDFASGEIAGADDMFPTISAWRYEGGAFDGARIPDHGEVWALRWEAEADGEAIAFSVDGVALPYRLTKRAWVSGDTLHLAYRVRNKSPFDLDVLWAFHPLFVLAPDGTLKPGANSGRCMLANSMGRRAGSFGDEFRWPLVRRGQEVFEADRGESDQNRYEKYYFKDPLEEGICTLYTGGERIRLLFDAGQTGYLGVWNNQGGYLGGNQLSPQPCTAPFDRPDYARLFDRFAPLPGYGEWNWQLAIQITIPGKE